MKKVIMTMVVLLLSSTLYGAQTGSLKKAYFAGGCFWGVEYHLEKLPGVKSAATAAHKQPAEFLSKITP